MSITKMTDDLDIIQALEDLPNDTGTPPLSAAELKEKFDEAGNTIKTYLNDTLTDELDTELAGKMPAPNDYGTSGQYLQTNGDGTVQWATPSGAGDMLTAVYDADHDGIVDNASVAASCSGNAATATSAAACTGNSATASKLAAARKISIQDADGTNTGAGVNFDGSGNATLKLPSTIKANVTGNCSGSAASCTGISASANKLATARNIGSASFDGTASISVADMGAAAASHTHSAGDITGANSTLAAFGGRRIYISSSDPTSSDGEIGDLWVKY